MEGFRWSPTRLWVYNQRINQLTPLHIKSAMRHIHTFTAALISLSLFLPSLSFSQESKPAPWYDVEIIVFAQNGAGAGSTENWPDSPEIPSMVEALRLPNTGYTVLPKSEWKLGTELKRLKRTRGRLVPLIHTAWRQPVLSLNAAQPLYIRSPGNISGETPHLDGTIKVSVKRYLHIEVDLLIRELRTTTAEGNGLFGSIFNSYRFTDHRRMRSKELHYIDHPKMGVLMLITPFEAPEPAVIPESVVDEEAGTTELTDKEAQLKPGSN